MPSTAFIMCQGQQQRIGHLLMGPKQLIEIQGSESIFERTVRLIRDVSGQVRIIAVTSGGTAWISAVSRAGCEMYVQPDPGGSVVGAIRNVEFKWGPDRTVVFLGDVVFSKRLVKRMLDELQPAGRFFGRATGGNPVTGKPFPEIFGLSFDRSCADKLILETKDRGWRHHQDTKLWGLLGRMGWPITESDDYTDDLDTEEDYVKRLPILRRAAAADVG